MLQALLVDDEPLARQRLRKLLTPFEKDRLRVVGEANDGVEALDVLDERAVDVLFLDIQMPELSGFDMLEKIPKEERPVVIFITAYDEYALQAFEANAVDYLLKPLQRDRLAEAIARAERLHQNTPLNEKKLEELITWLNQSDDTAAEDTYLDKITIPYRDRILVTPVSDLVSAEIEDGTTHLFVLQQEEPMPSPHLQTYVVNYTLEELEENLDPQHFMRVHRSSIVNLDHIKEMISWFSGRYKLVMTTGREVVASRQRSRKLKERLML